MTTSTASASVRTASLAVGDPAPDFTLKDQKGNDWTLSNAVKKGDVILAFVPFAFTGVCSTEMKCVSHDMEIWSRKGVTAVGISCDSPPALAAWAQRDGYSHTLLSDLHRHACKTYGLFWAEANVAQRATVIIGKSADGKGKIKSFEARPPGQAMNWETVLAKV